jgi:alginate O-acetyltransferase complex protein AlgI
MVFNSLTFVVFFAVVLALYWLLRSWTAKKVVLTAASYLFYGAWNPPFVALLLASTIVDWAVALRLGRTEDATARRGLLLISLGVNLGLLGFFKYGEFVLENFVATLQAAGMDYHPAVPNIILPVGISFYTFQTLSYTLDVYRRELEPKRSLLDFGLFVAFFPQLVAGPIVRARDFLPQCAVPRGIERTTLGFGLFLMTLGLFQKIVLADAMLADTADGVFGSPGPTSALDTWLGVIAFAGQIFCDFSGYSTCAIGAALCLGFSLTQNFRFPYAAIGLRDFWRRWHISLSTWLRDYLYIPLGGSRGTRMRTAMALWMTMLLGGLWHGASWNFVVWGGLHGFYLVVERALGRQFGDSPWVQKKSVQALLGLMTFGLVCLAWVFFRARDLPRAMMHIAAMLGAIPANPILPSVGVAKVVVVMVGLVGAHVAMRNRRLEDVLGASPSWFLAIAWMLMIGAIVLSQGGGNAFIYFQF